MRLIIIEGPNTGSVFWPEGDRCMIGRAHSNNVVLYDRRVSAHHAIIEPTSHGPVIRDLGSSNGTYVNGRLVSTSPLMPGDTIQVGDTVLAFERLPSEAAAEVSLTVTEASGTTTAVVRATAREEDSTRILAPTPPREDAESLREERRRLLALCRVATTMNSVRETRQLLTRVLEEIFEVFEAERGFILLLDDETGELKPAAMRVRHPSSQPEEVVISRTIANQVLENGEAVLSSDVRLDERFAAAESLVAAGTRSAMCAPLRGRERTHGIIYLDNAGRPQAFTARDLPLLNAMASQLGIALENARLVEARLADERFAAIGQAVAGLSHYIKNILAAMQGGAQLVERGLKRDDIEGLRRGWAVVRRNEGRIADLVLDMLDYSGASEPLFEDCDLNELVGELAESVGTRTRKQIAVERELKPDLPTVQVDPDAIHRCLVNLVANAIDALPEEGGRIRFITRHSPEENAVRIGVADNGCGIDPEILPNIFEVFVTTKGARGTGLGLAVVDKLIKEHGGKVEVESEPGKGTTFWLVLPLIRRPEAEELRQARAAGSHP